MVFRRYHAPVNLSTRERQLITTLVVLLIVLATFQILADLTEVLSRVADVVIIFVAAWAVSYLLSPLVNRIDQRTVLNRALSVVVVYIGIAIVLGIAFSGEIIDNWLGFRFAKRYGGSTRSGWGALLGGLVGAVIGVPIALIGSVIGAFVGSFIGAALFELSYSRHAGVAARAGWGAVMGRVAAAAVKIALGIVLAVIGIFAALS